MKKKKNNAPSLSKEEKKKAKKEKKLLKKEKKLAKKNRYQLYDPSKMQGSWLTMCIGYFLRFFAIGFSIFGVCTLVCDAFLLTEVSWIPLLIYCVFIVSAFSLIFIGGWLILAGIGLLGAYVGIFFAFAGNLHTFYVSGFEVLINRVMERLSSRGFAATGNISLPNFGGIDYELLIYGGVFGVATVLGLIFAAFSAKRTRLIPMLIFGGGLCVVCFTYNLCNTNWGIACVLAGLCSAIVLSAYDKIYRSHKKSKKSRAYSGYSAAIAGVLAMAILLIPTISIKDRFVEIEPISQSMEDARLILTTILTGGNPKFNKMNTAQREVSAKITDFEPTGAVLFTVGSEMSKRNVYLRGWIGSNYSPKNDTWTMLNDDDYTSLRKEVQNESSGFTGDDITAMLYGLFDSNVNSSGKGYYSNTRLGFVSSVIDIEYVRNTGLLYVLPSAYNSLRGLFEFESRTEGYNERMELYSDGIYRSSWFNLKKSYSAYAITPTYIEKTYAEDAEKMILYYQLLKQQIDNSHGYANSEENIAAFQEILESNNIAYFGVEPLSNYLGMNNSQKLEWYKNYISLVTSYTAYVNDFYTEVNITEGLQKVYDEIKPEVEKQSTTHDKLMCVIDYLVKNYEYSLTPTKPSGRYESDLDSFLLETKNGYCVQFATAATLLFRMMGYPARYVQGYVATGFEKPKKLTDEQIANGEKLPAAPYVSEVTDENAHAWVEVYIDGLGWRTYEPTPVYYVNIYEYKDELKDNLDRFDEEGKLIPDETETTDDETETTPPTTSTEPQTTTPEEEEKETSARLPFNVKTAITLLIYIIVIAAVIILLIWQIKRARKIVDTRRYIIDRAMYGSFESEKDKNSVASLVCDSIYDVHYIIGNRPRMGEDPTQFAARVDNPDLTKPEEVKKQRRSLTLPHTFGEITALIEKQEFGNVLTREELTTLGEYLAEFTRVEYKALNIFKKIWYRYIRFMI